MESEIPYVLSLLTYESVKIQAKAHWLLGEMGLIYSLNNHSRRIRYAVAER